MDKRSVIKKKSIINKIILIIICLFSVLLLNGCSLKNGKQKYVADDGKIDNQKFIDENIEVISEPKDQYQKNYEKIIIKNNSNFYINGMPFRLVDGLYLSEQSKQYYLFLRPHSEQTLYFNLRRGFEQFYLKSSPTEFVNVITEEEYPNISYANDITINNKEITCIDEEHCNVNFSNNTTHDIIPVKIIGSFIIYNEDYDGDYLILSPGYNNIDLTSVSANPENIVFHPGNNEFTVFKYSFDEIMSINFLGSYSDEFIQEVSQYEDYDGLVNGIFNI